VHRKTLNPVFNETFQFGVPLNELHSRKLHFSVYDFDRFSRHDLIGQVVVDNLLEFSEGSGDKPIWRDIVEGTAEKADLGELNFSLCYLPTAGRLTATVIKATNLKAMDLTGFSGEQITSSGCFRTSSNGLTGNTFTGSSLILVYNSCWCCSLLCWALSDLYYHKGFNCNTV
ncbi:Synaptotagmin-C, partial [Goodea atripinnis]